MAQVTLEPAAGLLGSTSMRVKARGDVVGYVNRLQTATFHKLLREGSVEATLDRLNGSSDRPRAFMFVRVRGSNQAAA